VIEKFSVEDKELPPAIVNLSISILSGWALYCLWKCGICLSLKYHKNRWKLTLTERHQSSLYTGVCILSIKLITLVNMHLIRSCTLNWYLWIIFPNKTIIPYIHLKFWVSCTPDVKPTRFIKRCEICRQFVDLKSVSFKHHCLIYMHQISRSIVNIEISHWKV